ncbi:MAG: SPOR domain-containing protein [Gammaproteobacteria bacterium]|nr:SPOR domain-containing protein [Gammaproteobacteria bacterium]
MRSTIVPLVVLLLAGCADLPVEITLGARPDTGVTHERRANSPPIYAGVARASRRECRMIRAIDGYAVCAPKAREVTPTTALPESSRKLDVALHIPAPQATLVDHDASGQVAGRYLVIGSFRERGNAERWAEFNAEFGTGVHAIHRRGPPVYRVLVGPLDDSDVTAILREILAAVGVGESWRLSICGKSARPGTCRDFEQAKLATVAEL